MTEEKKIEKDVKEEIDKKAIRERRVRMRRIRFWAIGGIIIIAIAGGITGFVLFQQTQEEQTELIVYCGAGMREPMEDIAEEFEDEYGVKIKYTFEGSNTLLSKIKLYQEGDVYMPGATSYIESAEEDGFIDETELIAYHIPVIAVHQGNPENVKDLEDFKAAQGIVFGDPEAAAIGKLGKKILTEKNGTDWEIFSSDVISWGATVNELVVWIATGVGNTSLIWKSSVVGVKDVEYVEIHEDFNIIKKIPIGTLTFSEEKKWAEKFIDFVASDGKDIFADHGFEVIEDDAESSSSLNRLYEPDYQCEKVTLTVSQNLDYVEYNGITNIWNLCSKLLINSWIGC